VQAQAQAQARGTERGATPSPLLLPGNRSSLPRSLTYSGELGEGSGARRVWARGGGSTAAPCALLSVSDPLLDWRALPDFRMIAVVLGNCPPI